MNGLDIRSPATIFDMAEYGGARTALQWAIVKEMHAGGHSWLVRRGETVLGLFGVYPVDEHTGEAWFNVRPAASTSTLRLLRAIRLTLHDLPYREILTICITPEGARVAAAAGFKRDAPCDMGEIWKWYSC
ncbi:MAG: hypothetical protein CMF72_22820 [Mameliella sp.]|nr:hypothetical protein [Mameliella sp.]|tara:strand:- start:225 stop:617 length:393 start_codon:yes stop_codon:yes gene_type:complete